MTNEELVQKIKDGDHSYIEQLWLSVKAFVALQAFKFYARYKNVCQRMCVSEEDLIQSGYFALIAAIDKYTPDEGCTFLSYFGLFYLKSAFQVAIGQRNYNSTLRKKQAAISGESINSAPTCEVDLLARSLDDPLKGIKDNSETSLHELIPDPDAELAMRQVEESDYQQKLQEDLRIALAHLPEKQAYCIQARFYRDQTQQCIAENMGYSPSYVRSLIQAGLGALRRDARLAEYREELISTQAHKGGFKSWYQSWSSVQERILLQLEEKEKRLNEYIS